MDTGKNRIDVERLLKKPAFSEDMDTWHKSEKKWDRMMKDQYGGENGRMLPVLYREPSYTQRPRTLPTHSSAIVPSPFPRVPMPSLPFPHSSDNTLIRQTRPSTSLSPQPSYLGESSTKPYEIKDHNPSTWDRLYSVGCSKVICSSRFRHRAAATGSDP